MDNAVNFWTIAGIFLILSGLLMRIYPPKFKKSFLGIKTKWTVVSPELWQSGHHLFGYCYIFIGVIVLTIGLLEIKTKADLIFVISIIVLGKLSVVLVNYLLEQKYSKNSEGLT